MISQSGVVDISLSDHQLIYCTRKKTKIKPGTHKTIKIRSFKNYSAEKLCEMLGQIDFRYDYMAGVNESFLDFSKKLINVIDTIAPNREYRIKSQSEDWFDGEIKESIKCRDKIFKNFKKSKLEDDYDAYKKARSKTQILMKNKKTNYFKQKVVENTGNPKKIWQTLNGLGMKSKHKSRTNISLEKDGEVSFDPKINAWIFKDFFSNLTNDLLSNLPTATSKYGMDFNL